MRALFVFGVVAMAFMLADAGSYQFNGVANGWANSTTGSFLALDLAGSANVGGDFTVEFFVKIDDPVQPGPGGNNDLLTCQRGTGLYQGVGGFGKLTARSTIFFDRTINSQGLPLNGGYIGGFFPSQGNLPPCIAFSAGKPIEASPAPNTGITACSAEQITQWETEVDDGFWHHVAFTRNSGTGEICIWRDGRKRDCQVGPSTPPTGAINLGYNQVCNSANPETECDYFLLRKMFIGCPKLPGQGGQFKGIMTEFAIFDTIKYPSSSDTYTMPTARYTAATPDIVALLHMDDQALSGTESVSAQVTLTQGLTYSAEEPPLPFVGPTTGTTGTTGTSGTTGEVTTGTTTSTGPATTGILIVTTGTTGTTGMAATPIPVISPQTTMDTSSSGLLVAHSLGFIALVIALSLF